MLGDKDKSMVERHRRTLAQWDQYWWFVAIMYIVSAIALVVFTYTLARSIIEYSNSPDDSIGQRTAMSSAGIAVGLILGVLFSLAFIFVPVRMHYIRQVVRVLDAC
jgi:uncharacterized BrkB/YihY/UPF0761 family membrane protein